MTATRSEGPPSGAATVGATYLAVLLLGGLGAAIGLVMPCEGFLCSIGNAVLGGIVGALVSAPVAAYVARRDGVRWWYTPIAYGIPVALLGAQIGLPSVAKGVPDAAVWVLAAAAPFIALALAGRMRGWVRAVIVGVVAAAAVVVPTLDQQGQEARWAEQRRAQVATWRRDGLPVYAPVSRIGVQVNDLGFTTGPDGVRRAWYDLAQEGWGGEARVMMATGQAAESRCDTPRAADLGDGVRSLGPAEEATTVCRTFDGVEISLWQDGSEGAWRGPALVDLARDLEAVDGSWLEAHLRGR